MTGTQVRDESKRALFGWSPPDLPADTALKRRADRLLPRTGWAAVLYCAAVIGLLNLAPHLPERGNLAVDGLAALAAAAWCGLNFWRCRHAHCIVTSAGWAALSLVSGRCVYAGVAEVSVYVADGARGRGVGNALMMALIRESEQNGIWTLQAGIFPENAASIKLHQRSGFRIVGTRERTGQLNGSWRDVVLMERRSKTVGV